MQDSQSSPQFEGAELIINSGAEQSTIDARSLISTLLVYVAKSDGHLSSLETDRMIGILAAKYGDHGAAIMEQLSASIMALANDRDIARTLHEVASGLSDEERRDIFSLVLELAMVDDHLDSGEANAIKFAGQILGLSQNEIYSGLRTVRAES